MMRKGIDVLQIEVVQVVAEDPDCLPTEVHVSWSDLGELYQLQRSLNGGAYSVIYTGTGISLNESFGNVDATYSYQVLSLSTGELSNVAVVTPREQNKTISNNCYPAYNVAPYYRRKITRTKCSTETPTDTIDVPNCCQNDNAITAEGCLDFGNEPYTYRVTRFNNCLGTYSNTDSDDDERCKDVGTGTDIQYTVRFWRYVGDQYTCESMPSYSVTMRAGYVITGKPGDFVPASHVWTCNGNNSFTASCASDVGDYHVSTYNVGQGGCQLEITITGHFIT